VQDVVAWLSVMVEDKESLTNDFDDRATQDLPRPPTSSPPSFPRKPIVVTAVITTVIAVLATYVALVALRPHNPAEDPQLAGEAIVEAYYFDASPLLVNLRQLEGEKTSMLKVAFRLEVLKKSDLDIIKVLAPRIKDDMQIYLRELSLNDLSEPDCLRKIKDDILTRVNSICAPVQVQSVLIKDFITQ